MCDSRFKTPQGKEHKRAADTRHRCVRLSGFNVKANVQPPTCTRGKYTRSVSAALTWNNFNSFQAPSCLHHSLTARNNNVESSRCGKTHTGEAFTAFTLKSVTHIYTSRRVKNTKLKKIIPLSIHPPPLSPLTGLERLETIPAAIGRDED